EAFGVKVSAGAALLVSDHFPIAVDAGAVGVEAGPADGRADLAAVSHVAHGRERVFLPAAAGDATGAGHAALDLHVTFGADHEVRAEDVVTAVIVPRVHD